MIAQLLDAAGIAARHASATIELDDEAGGGTAWAVAAGLLEEGKAVELSHRMGPAALLAFGELGPPKRQGMTLKLRVLRRSDASLALRLEKDFFEEEAAEIAMTMARALAKLVDKEQLLDDVDAPGVLGSGSPEALLRLQEGLDCLAAAAGGVKGGDVARAIDLLLSALEEDRRCDLARDNVLGTIASHAESTLGLAEAAAKTQRLVDLTRNDTDALLLLARIHQRQGDVPVAREVLEAALYEADAGPRMTLTAELVKVLNQLGELDEVIARCQEALDLDELDASLEATYCEELGLALARAGRLDDANSSLQRAVELDPDRSKAWANLGRCRRLLGDDRAREALEKSLALDAESWEATWSLVEIAIEQSELQRAVELLSPWPNKRPDDPRPTLTLAELLIADKRLEESRQILTVAVERNPGEPRFHALLGGIATQFGELDAAETEYREALRLDPDNPGLLSNLAVVLSQRGQLSEAERLARQAVELDPDDELSRKVLDHILSIN